MRRCVLIVLLMVFGIDLLAQDQVSPVVGQRIMRILERAAEDPDRALRNFTELAQARGLRDSDRGFVIREHAALLIREERSAEARQLLSDSLQGREDSFAPPLRLLYAQVLLLDGEASAALPHLELWAANTTEPHPLELSMLAYAYLQEERWRESAEVFERVIANSDVENAQWLELLAYAYSQDGRTDQAITLIEETIVANPAEARWWRQLANIFLLIDDYDNGAASFGIADHVENLSFEDSKRLSGLLSLLNMPAEAAAILASALEDFPQEQNYEDQMLLGELWMLAREHEQAIAAFQQAVDLSEDGEPAMMIAQLHLQWERYTDARQALEQAQLAYGENTPERVFYLRAIVEINLQDLEAASVAIGRLDHEGEFAERAANLDRFIENLRANGP
ncbi:MAG: tetratricopeptide repeat protein [Pseudomonadales bacterium]|nr:tetratricopeptide repeat protein [Pseudomonadales bacterium]